MAGTPFNPAAFGATPVTTPSFNASKFGATPAAPSQSGQGNGAIANPFGTSTVPDASFNATPAQPNADGSIPNPFNQGASTPSGPQPQGGLSGVATGIDKQVASLPFTVAALGKNIANTAGAVAGKIPVVGPAIDKFLSTPAGSPADKSTQIPSVLQPKNTSEQVGNVLAQIGEFLIPGAAEKSAISSVSDLVDLLDNTKLEDAIGTKGASLVKGILKAAGTGVVTGTTSAGVTAAQTGGDPSQVATSAEFGAGAGALGSTLEQVAPSLMKSLQKADFKLSPTQATKGAQKAEQAATFLTDNNIVGSATTKFKKLTNLTTGFEDALQNSIPEQAGVPIKDVIDSINSRVETLKTSDPAVYKATRSEANDAIALLQENGGDNGTISMKDTLSAKRSYGQQAFRSSQAAKIADPRVTQEGAFAVEQGYQSALEQNMARISGSVDIPSTLQSYFGGQSQVSIPDFNRTYSNLLSARSLTGMAANKSDAGLIGRFLGLWIGETVGQTVMPGLGGKMAGAVAGELASTHLPGAVRNVMERATTLPASTIPIATKAGLGIYQGSQPNPDNAPQQ